MMNAFLKAYKIYFLFFIFLLFPSLAPATPILKGSEKLLFVKKNNDLTCFIFQNYTIYKKGKENSPIKISYSKNTTSESFGKCNNPFSKLVAQSREDDLNVYGLHENYLLIDMGTSNIRIIEVYQIPDVKNIFQASYVTGDSKESEPYLSNNSLFTREPLSTCQEKKNTENTDQFMKRCWEEIKNKRETSPDKEQIQNLAKLPTKFICKNSDTEAFFNSLSAEVKFEFKTKLSKYTGNIFCSYLE